MTFGRIICARKLIKTQWFSMKHLYVPHFSSRIINWTTMNRNLDNEITDQPEVDLYTDPSRTDYIFHLWRLLWYLRSNWNALLDWKTKCIDYIYRGVQTRKFQKRVFEITVDPKGPLIGPTYWSGLELQNPLAPIFPPKIRFRPKKHQKHDFSQPIDR